jgi:hypothetical protein
MRVHFLDQFVWPAVLEEDAARLESAAADLRRIAALRRPDPAVLEAAPVLHGYGFAFRTAPVLIGSVSGHPLLADGTSTTTSDLLAISESGGYARTLSRWYRLERGK